MIRPQDRLIVALDVDTKEEAVGWVKRMTPLGVTHFKIGLNLFTLAGPAAVERVHRSGGRVFLDLKFHDIPNTVFRTVRAAARMGVWMMNVHIQGGAAMMRRALEGLTEGSSGGEGERPILLGVTVLTSLADRDLADLGVLKPLKDQVLHLAKQAQGAGLDGIVASAQEAQAVRQACGEKFLIITPGIRSEAAPFAGAGLKEDQQRAVSPREAIRAGSDYLVVGRPILEAADPAAAAREILRQIEGD